MNKLHIDTAFIDEARAGSVKAFACFEQGDLEVSRMFTSDLCYAVALLAGRTIRLVATAMDGDKELERLVVPAICQKCVLEGLAGIVERAIGTCPVLEWVDQWPVNQKDTQADRADGSGGLAVADGLKVGIIGTAPLCFEPFLNDHIAKLVESLGYTLIYPRPESLFTDDVRYEDELARFYDLGVRKVIYLQSFGCLKGHVHARGALHDLAKKFPALHITVLDYDAEASALNRENRIRLALGLS